MEIKLIAFESFGVRSQATFVQTRDATIFIDPSAALAPRRYGLPPHKVEVLKLIQIFDIIEDHLRDTDYIIITHYHYDHHDPGKFIDPSIYKNKVFYIKDPQNNINVSQRIRAHRFLKLLNNASNITYIDGREIYIGRTRIVFSQPVPHGENARLGYVVEVCIDDGENVLLYTSDVEGMPLAEQLNFAISCNPNIAIIDGVPTYLLGYKYSWKSFEKSVISLQKLLSLDNIEIIVYDHHVAREINYMDKFSDLTEYAASLGKRILCAAEFMNTEPQFLEALRKKLFEDSPEDGLLLLKERNPKIDITELGE